jgi:two-component system, OmpR family, response regulator
MGSNGGPRVLVVEDDDTVREALISALGSEGYEVVPVADGSAVAELLREAEPDLAVLDVRLPGDLDGFALGRTIRERSDAPILYLTAADAVTDRLAGFRAGADDYVIKPFVMAELLARIEALLRRAGRFERSRLERAGDITVDTELRTATRDGTAITLTRTEFDLLLQFIRNENRVLSKSQLLSLVWEYDDYESNLVEVHVSALRRKLEQHGPRVIRTIRGFGYVMKT